MTDRWKALGVSMLQPGQKEASTADLLFHALAPTQAEDPVEGLILGVREDLDALASLSDDVLGASLHRLARRLDVAVALLRQVDGRVSPPADKPVAEQGADDPFPKTKT